MCAVATGNLTVATKLIEDYGADVHNCMQVSFGILGMPKGTTPIHAFAGFTPVNHTAMLQLLLDHGADPNDTSMAGGFMPLVASIATQSIEGLRTLIEVGGRHGLEINQRVEMNKTTALNVATYMGTEQQVKILIDAGADVMATNDHGSMALHDAASNPGTTSVMLEMITAGGVDINAIRVPKNCKWWLLDKVMETQYTLKIDRSDFVESFANTRGSTPLHEAAYMGHLSTLTWLLEHGATPSLTVKNKLKLTPLGCAKLGKHEECVRALLQAERAAAGLGGEPGAV
mmetsp:Transcript_80358/g.228820  ORF Transcript_80358/g.228820 Transcript_80358/m.228820 type:complete len:287 (-) Transcript_80358:673-1533(-)